MSTVEQKFYTTGANKGKTVKLGKYLFEEGVMLLRCAAHELALHARSLERNWCVYPEGHDKLKEADNGTGEVPASGANPAGTEAVPGSGDANPAQAGDQAAVSTPNAEAAAGGAGDSSAAADGHEAGLNADGQPAPQTNDKLTRAVKSLDPTNDDHWTADGKPAVMAVQKAYGSADVTRADVAAAAPNFDREAAKAGN